MLQFLKKRLSDATVQAITPTVLMTAMDSALDLAFGRYAISDVDDLIAKTGKSRDELLRICLNDDEVSACIDDIESAIKARPWRIYDDVDRAHAGVSPQLINKFYKHIRTNIKTFARLAVTAKLNGYAIAEYVYAKDADGFIYIDKVLDKEGQLHRFEIKSDKVIYHGAYRDEVVSDVKLLTLTYKATQANPTGQMSIVKIYPAVLLRQKGWAYAGQFIARYAQPYVVGKQGGFSLMEGFTQRLFEFINGGATGIGAEDDISIHQLSGNGEAFSTIEKLANQRIQKFLLGRVKTSELNSGSRSAQETDDKVRDDRISGYLELMSEAIQHAIDAMIAVNEVFGVSINAPQGLWFEYVEQQAVDIDRATRDKLYCDTGQMRLTKEYLMDMVGFEEHHFVMADTPKSLPLSLRLSDDNKENNHIHHDDESLTAKQTKIHQTKVDKVLSLFDGVNDFAEFQQRLNDLDLGDDGFVDELAATNTQAYINGLQGKEE